MGNSRTNKYLSKKQLTELKDKVLAEKERIQTKLAVEKAQMDAMFTDSGKDEVDSANDDILRHTELRFATRETLYLKKLNKTALIMENDEYGMCNDCGSEIGFQRMLARPTSDMCISCKEEAERGELQSFHGRQSKSLGKTVTLSK